MCCAGDPVTCEAVESIQDRYLWRAINITLSNNNKSKIESGKVPIHFDIQNGNVEITNDLYFNSTKLNVNLPFTFNVLNTSSDELVLQKVRFAAKTLRCELHKPEEFSNLIIKPRQQVYVNGSCTTKNMGMSKELLLFEFGLFKVGRWVTTNVEVSGTEEEFKPETDSKASVEKDKYKLDTNIRIIRGPRPFEMARFKARRLPSFVVPKTFYNFMVECLGTSPHLVEEELKKFKPCLMQELSLSVYEEMFHTLLYLLEIHEMFAIRDYDRNGVCFVKNGEYLVLEIENLAEKRPSLLIGDKVICTDTCSKTAPALEGFIYKICSNFIYIKFAPSVHQNYDGQKFAIRMEGSRAMHRRAHQAVNFAALNLAKILFPVKVSEKDVQVDIWHEPYDDTLKLSNETNLHTATKIKSKTPLVQNRATKLLNALKSNKPKLDWFDKSLNYHQKEAVRNVLLGKARPLPYLIFGPPGTGKTVTLVETILQIHHMIPHACLLVCTPSNSAADVLALRLVSSGMLGPRDMVRLVAHRCVTENLVPSELTPYAVVADINQEGTKLDGSMVTQSGITLGKSLIDFCIS